MSRGRRRFPSIPEQLIDEPFWDSMEVTKKVLDVEDVETLERYARLHTLDEDDAPGHNTVDSVLKEELGVDLGKLTFFGLDKPVRQYNGATFVNGAYPIYRVSRIVSAAAILKLVRKYGYTPERIRELRGDDLFHVNLLGVYEKILG